MLFSPKLRKYPLLRASFITGEVDIRQGLVPPAPSCARHFGTPNLTNSRNRVVPLFHRFQIICLSLRLIHPVQFFINTRRIRLPVVSYPPHYVGIYFLDDVFQLA